MKVGIVVPFSWSFWGAVLEHAELQAEALRARGHDVKIVIGNDPPGTFTRALHPRHGRHDDPPPDVIPVGRTVIVPANGSLPNICLSPSVPLRLKRVFADEQFDVLHLHEPMTPAICVSALAVARCPIVATWHAAGSLGWMRAGVQFWGFLLDRIDWRIAVSDQARSSAQAWFRGWDFEVIPNGVLIPREADPGDRDDAIVFIGRHDPRKGMPVLLKAWSDVHRRTGARLRLVGADPLAVQLLLARYRIPRNGIDVLGFLPQDDLTRELLRAKALAAPSVGQESFGMVLTRAFACAVPVVASDIPGYRAVMTDDTGAARTARRRPRACRRARRPARGRAAPTASRRRSAAGRDRAVFLGPDRRSARADLRGCRRVKRLLESHLLRSPWTRGGIALAFVCGVGALLWWHGPHWSDFRDAFTTVQWEWVAAAVGFNLLSIVARAGAWDTVIRSAMPPPHPAFPLVFAAFCVGLLANAVLPGRVGELARVAVLTRRVNGTRPGLWSTLVGTVFAHRVFDLVPGRTPGRPRAHHGETSRGGHSRAC